MNQHDLLKVSRARQQAISGEAKHIRQSGRLSLADVAGACQVSPSAVHRWENGQVAPRGRAALRYANLLGRLGDLQTDESEGHG
jgi:transcriptional regulator with XRE-family HTH domain